VPDVGETARNWIELIVGVALIAGAAFLALSRDAAQPDSRQAPGSPAKAAALGATIAAVELPTALPYFAAIAVIVGSGLGVGDQLILITTFNIVFVSPLLAMIGLLAVAGPRATDSLRRIGDALRTHWRVAFAWLAGAAGVLLVVLGATGLTGLR